MDLRSAVTTVGHAVAKQMPRAAVRRFRESADLHLLRSTELFDSTHYLRRYPEVADLGMDPTLHYLRYGAKEAREPSLLFDAQDYLARYPDVAASGMNPLVHYLRHGRASGREARSRGLEHTGEEAPLSGAGGGTIASEAARSRGPRRQSSSSSAPREHGRRIRRPTAYDSRTHKAHDEPREVITITGKTDGFGAQYQALMSGIAYCAAFGHIYKHTPLKKVLHVSDVAKLNEFIGLTDDADAASEEVTLQLPYVEEVHSCPHPSEFYTEEVLAKIRQAYYSTPKYPGCEYDVAVHVRRGDVSDQRPTGLARAGPSRYTPDEVILEHIESIRRRHPGCTVCIYSEGGIEDFARFRQEGVFFDLNGGIAETFHSLVTAKVLMTARSSFSYSAALLSEGTVYYLPFWHGPLDHWQILPEIGSDTGQILA